MAITALPTPPSRQQPEATFATNADAFLGALPTFVTEANALQADVNSKQATASAAATTATTKAGEALASANAAAASASSADTSAGQAAGSASDAADIFSDMDKRYLGAKSTEPSTDNQGQPLQVGAVYYDTALGKVRTWNGSAFVEGISAVAGVTSVNGATGAVTGIQKETGPKYTLDTDGTVSGTWAINYANGPVISATTGGNITAITVSNWPTSGTAGHLKLLCTNFGAYTITFPSSWKFTKADMTSVAFADLGITLPATGTVVIDLLTVDGGVNVLAAVMRN